MNTSAGCSKAIVTTPPAASLKRKNAVFAEPPLVAEIEYRACTDNQKLRHRLFKGVREQCDVDRPTFCA
ncbi:ATP dependent DNA ligase [Sinorhizobium meliloti]|uniref:ATP dependent DNA ligase n=1 Tax=Rhizobium meliloti TaxID=382 RepID=UPI000FD99593|nr:hypothetical protein [Sinorhizobium meliloti]RVK16994.1 hypothetical protein CN164_03560 [Sinorhizobium meliloti]